MLMDPCGTCPACVQVRNLTHPDLDFVCRPEDKSFLPLELLIGDKEKRGKEGLCHRLSMKPFMGGRKIAIIDDADYLNPEGANSLLKTLEEPPPRSVLILIGTSPAKQLPTIRSRCQLIRFQPLEASIVRKILLDNGLVEKVDDAERLAKQSGGSVRRAIELMDESLWGIRERIMEGLIQPEIDCVGLSAEILRFAEQAGREGATRRERLRQAIGAAAEFYETLLRRRYLETSTDGNLPDESHPRWGGSVSVDSDTLARCLERCLDVAEYVERNAYPATLVECWLDDLAAQWTAGQHRMRQQ